MRGGQRGGVRRRGRLLLPKRRGREHGIDLGAVEIAAGEERLRERVEGEAIGREQFQRFRLGGLERPPHRIAQIGHDQEIARREGGDGDRPELAEAVAGLQPQRQLSGAVEIGAVGAAGARGRFAEGEDLGGAAGEEKSEQVQAVTTRQRLRSS